MPSWCLLACICFVAQRVATGLKFNSSSFVENSPIDDVTRYLGTIKPQSITIGDGTKLHFESIVPVFGGGESFVAFLVRFDDQLWEKVKGLSLSCATKDGKHQALMQKRGGETEAAYKSFMVLRCDWPEAAKDQTCHSIVVREGDVDAGTVQACHNTGILRDSYKMAACVPIVWEEADHLEASGIMMLPQWIEYNAMHGVEQFLVYTMLGSDPRIGKIIDPYIKSGLVAHVHVDRNNNEGLRPDDYSAQQLLGNDCLYRMKHHATWLLPFIDADEYLSFSPKGPWPAAISKLLQLANASVEARASNSVHAIDFGRQTFRHPSSPSQELQISSPFREAGLAPLCPKYIVHPPLVNTLFVHWPTSWEPSSKNLHMPWEETVAHHYRTLDTSKTTVEERTLQDEVRTLSTKIGERYGFPWPTLAASLSNSVTNLIRSKDLASQDNSWMARPEIAHFIMYVNNLRRPTFINPPRLS